MPTYEYVCEKCGKTFESFQKMSDAPIKICSDETCKGSVHRLLSGGAGFLFKGSGFYITDYRSDSYKKAAEKDKPSSGQSSSAAPASKPSAPSQGAGSSGSGSGSSQSSPKS
jgi:putative FmdB family regulatory protein